MKKIKIIEEGILNTHDMLEIKGGEKASVCTKNRCPIEYFTKICWNLFIVCGDNSNARYHSCWDNGGKLICNTPRNYSVKIPLP